MDDLNQLIISLLRDVNYRRFLGKNARESVIQNNSLRIIKNAELNLFNKIVEKN